MELLQALYLSLGDMVFWIATEALLISADYYIFTLMANKKGGLMRYLLAHAFVVFILTIVALSIKFYEHKTIVMFLLTTILTAMIGAACLIFLKLKRYIVSLLFFVIFIPYIIASEIGLLFLNVEFVDPRFAEVSMGIDFYFIEFLNNSPERFFYLGIIILLWLLVKAIIRRRKKTYESEYPIPYIIIGTSLYIFFWSSIFFFPEASPEFDYFVLMSDTMLTAIVSVCLLSSGLERLLDSDKMNGVFYATLSGLWGSLFVQNMILFASLHQ